jgi:predicted secreted hydrolase
MGARGVFGEAGSGDGDRLVWVGDWNLRQPASGTYALSAANQEMAIQLNLSSQKGPVFHGENGISAKSPDAGNASHYFSHTRLLSTGTLRLGSKVFEVEGNSWFDREWSTSVLSQGVSGWDWFSIQLESDAELMLFQLRRPDGSSAFTSATLVEPDGTTRSLPDGAVRFSAGQTWKNPRTGVSYPIQWRAEIPSLAVSLQISAAIPNQELQLATVSYWEGATVVEGTSEGKPVRGRGYLEMTGYSSALTVLR